MATSPLQKRKRVLSDAKKAAQEHGGGYAPTAFVLPDGVGLFQFSQPGRYKVDVIGFTAGEGNPRAKPGFFHYERIYYTHPKVGAKEQTYCCPAKTFGHECPICEYREELKAGKSADKETIKALYPKERQLMLFVNREVKGEPAIQVYEGPYYKGLGEKIDQKCDLADEDSDYRTFHDPDGGYRFNIGVKKSEFTTPSGFSGSFMEIVDLEFMPRKEGLPESLLDKAPCLDELLIEPDYQDLYNKFHRIKAEEATEPSTNGEVVEETVAEEVLPEEEVVEEAVAEELLPEEEVVEEEVVEELPPEEEVVVEEVAEELTDEEPVYEEPAAPVSKKVKHNLAAVLGISKGDTVSHDEFGITVVTKVSPDGSSLTLEDEDGHSHMAVSPTDVQKIEIETPKKAPPVKKPASPVAPRSIPKKPGVRK